MASTTTDDEDAATASSSVPFSGLAPDARQLRHAGELSTFDITSAIALSRQIAHSVAAASASGAEPAEPLAEPLLETIANAIADAINAYEHDGRPGFAFVGVFTNDEQNKSLATRGAPIDAAVARAYAHAPSELPVAAVAAFHRNTNDAHDAPLRAYDVQSIVGFTIPSSLTVIAFARTTLPATIRRDFEIVAHQVRVLLINNNNDSTEARDDLTRVLESHIGDTLRHSRERIHEATTTAQEEVARVSEQLTQHNKDLQRTQRAMLNVIEDLREARAALEVRVEERTRELARTNALLEARNRDLEEFAYIASHDLQEPLRTVAGYLQMVERRYGTKIGEINPEGVEFIHFAIEGAQRMQRLIESLLTYSRVTRSAASLAPISLNEPLEQAISNLAVRIEESGATITRPTHPLPSVRADAVQMVQVFQNLLSNALKFAGDQTPRVTITSAIVTSEDGEEHAEIAVRDEGIGFDPKFADRIFKVFRRLRRDTPGTGIGLAICKKIVERHSGRIEATSKLGVRGATFTIHLPIESARHIPTVA
jgi:signal transduction histidine kinase